MLTKDQHALVAAAATPEEAAQIFKHACTIGLAEVMAKALDDALAKATAGSASKPAIAGWESFVAGCALEIDWSRTNALSKLPLLQIATFAPRATTVKLAGVDVSVGISISGRF